MGSAAARGILRYLERGRRSGRGPVSAKSTALLRVTPIARAPLVVERLGERHTELVADLAPITPSAPVAQNLAELGLRTRSSPFAGMHERVRSA
jgi:hypothetical protein